MIALVASSLLISVSAFAGELAVSGSANASYVVNGGFDNSGKALGISNELMFKASGELDNGYTWNYHMELDPNNGGTTDNDDTALTINTNGLGTVGIFDSEGGLSTELSWGIGAVGVGQDYANTMGSTGRTSLQMGFDVSSFPNVQYHMPADLLPFGIQAKVGYAPNTSDSDGNSYKNSGVNNPAGVSGQNLTQYQVTAAPIDGLKIGADYASFGGESGVADMERSGGNVFAQYAIGNFKVGYMIGATEQGTVSLANGDGTTPDMHEYNAYGIEFAVNDNLSISYSEEEHDAIDKGTIAAGNASMTETTTTMDADSYQVAYNIGGATLGLFYINQDNSDFTAGQEEKKTIASISMEF
jgi:hypothetical protein